MFPEKIENAFEFMQEAIQRVQESLDVSFFDAYIENAENLIDNGQVRVMDGQPAPAAVQQLTELYGKILALDLAPEEWRKLIQLVLLKGSRDEQLQPNHQLTPDSIGFLFVYFIEQLYPDKKRALTLLDVASGMGNLLLTVLLNLQLAGYSVGGAGVDIDDTLLAIAAANSELVQADTRFFHQDGLQDLLLDPVDVVMGDLPVGYYPNDEKAQQFLMGVSEGHSYAHHLLLEQGMKYLKPDGIGLFMVPSNILETEQSGQVKQWLQSEVYLQAMIQLPDELFKSASSRKSILLLQNRTEETEQVQEVFVAKVASLKEPLKVKALFNQFEDWKSSNL